VRMRPDLDGAIAGVLDADPHGRTPGVELDVTGFEKIFAGEHRRFLADRIVDGHQLGAVGERALDLDLADHLRHAVHHLGAGQDPRAEVHQLRDAASVPDALEHFGADQRHGFGMIQLQAARAPPPRHVGRGEDEQLVDLALGEPHDARSTAACSCGMMRVSVAIISCTTRATCSEPPRVSRSTGEKGTMLTPSPDATIDLMISTFSVSATTRGLICSRTKNSSSVRRVFDPASKTMKGWPTSALTGTGPLVAASG